MRFDKRVSVAVARALVWAAGVYVASGAPSNAQSGGASDHAHRPLPREAVGIMVSASGDDALRPPGRPRLTLVLSGGGARGAAHIGVLKILDQLEIAPDLVVGTSMGSVVGGLYAAGWTPSEIETLLSEVNLAGAFIDRVPREDKSFRRKKDDDLYLIPAKIKFKGWKPWLPPSVLGTNRLELLLEAVEYSSVRTTDFDDLPIAYRAVATDLLSGEAVIIGEGRISTAMRASMAVPAVFPPVPLNGRTLVDGGAVANLPVRIAQALGAERIIAVDITSTLASDVENATFLNVMDQQSSFLTVSNRLADVAHLKPEDVRIVPELGDISFRSFDRLADAIAAGETAGRLAEPALRSLGMDSAAWNALSERRRRRPTAAPVVDEVVIRNTAPIKDEIVRESVALHSGEQINPRTFPAKLMRLSGDEFYGNIDTDLRDENGRKVLEVSTPAKPFGNDTLQLGVGLENDFQGGAFYGLILRHQSLPLNRHGGEWQSVAQVGSTLAASTELYQPLDTAMHWFVAPRLYYRSYRTDLYFDGNAVANYRVQDYGGEFAVGRALSNWGRLSIALSRSRAEGTRKVGPETFPSGKSDYGGWLAQFELDTRENTGFYRHGARVLTSYAREADWLGAEFHLERVFASATQSYSFGKSTITPYVEVYSTFDDVNVDLPTAYRLGGFGRVSGLAEGELLGTRGGLARLGYLYQWADLDLGMLSTRAYFGCTFEGGNTFFEGDSVSSDQLILAGSVFVAADTVIGPAYLGYGLAEGGRSSVYLMIGKRF